jgi:NADPH:quinone reductase-like Zn-dependent oxidoreductase
MKAARILQFGPPTVIQNADVARPEPAEGQALVKVKAAGVGPWDALVREGKSVISQPLPLILGSDLSGTVEAVGAGASPFQVGDEVYGVTNQQFTGAYAEYALASATMLAHKPKALSFVEAASAPVVAVTAWQMLFDYAHASAGQTALVHGAAGNVGSYAVQLARQAGVHVIATAAARDMEYVRNLGAGKVVNYQTTRFEEVVNGVDIVLDTVGGDTRERSFPLLKRDGVLVSVVSPIPEGMAEHYGVRAVFFLVEVTTPRLNRIANLFDHDKLVPRVGTVLPLEEARQAHEMLAGAPHKPGKIVLKIAA